MAANHIYMAYNSIRERPRTYDQYHVTLMGNDIRDLSMASDDPFMQPDEDDLAMFNLSESVTLWRRQMHIDAMEIRWAQENLCSVHSDPEMAPHSLVHCVAA